MIPGGPDVGWIYTSDAAAPPSTDVIPGKVGWPGYVFLLWLFWR